MKTGTAEPPDAPDEAPLVVPFLVKQKRERVAQQLRSKKGRAKFLLQTMTIDTAKLPPEAAPLVPMIERWGITDDEERVLAIDNATDEELAALATCLDDVDHEAIFDWLAGPASYVVPPTDEYVALTCLTMAVDLARHRTSGR